MPYKDPEQMKAYQRDYQREKRAAEVKPAIKKPLTLEAIATAAGIRNLLASVISDVRAAELDIVIKARCIGYLAGITLKAIDTADIETRLQVLEENILKGGQQH